MNGMESDGNSMKRAFWKIVLQAFSSEYNFL